MFDDIVAFRTLKAWVKKWIHSRMINAQLIFLKTQQIQNQIMALDCGENTKKMMIQNLTEIFEANLNNKKEFELFDLYFSKRMNVIYVEKSIERERLMVQGVKTRGSNGE